MRLQVQMTSTANLHTTNCRSGQLYKKTLFVLHLKYSTTPSNYTGRLASRELGAVGLKTLMLIWQMRKPNDKLLRNVLMKAENVVNSPPLTYVLVGMFDQHSNIPTKKLSFTTISYSSNDKKKTNRCIY